MHVYEDELAMKMLRELRASETPASASAVGGSTVPPESARHLMDTMESVMGSVRRQVAKVSMQSISTPSQAISVLAAAAGGQYGQVLAALRRTNIATSTLRHSSTGQLKSLERQALDVIARLTEADAFAKVGHIESTLTLETTPCRTTTRGKTLVPLPRFVVTKKER